MTGWFQIDLEKRTPRDNLEEAIVFVLFGNTAHMRIVFVQKTFDLNNDVHSYSHITISCCIGMQM